VERRKNSLKSFPLIISRKKLALAQGERSTNHQRKMGHSYRKNVCGVYSKHAKKGQGRASHETTWKEEVVDLRSDDI